MASVPNKEDHKKEFWEKIRKGLDVNDSVIIKS
jgi:hypothetical protein